MEIDALKKEESGMVGIYARVSTDKQNVKQQRDYLASYCKQKGLVYRSYMDEAMSGMLKDRPSWLRLLRDSKKGSIKTILVMKYDRITRDLEYAIEFLAWLRSNPNVRLISMWDGGLFDFADPDQEFYFLLNCLMSQRELKMSKKRSKIGIDRAKKEGKYKGRPLGSKNKI